MSDPTRTFKQQAIDAHSRQARKFAEEYDAAVDNPYRDCFAYSRHRLQGFLDRFLPSRGEGRRLLDVGCGTGHHLVAFRARGFAVAGIDGSAEMLEEARKRVPAADLRQADVESLPHADATFDFVVCIEVLRYLPRPEPCLRELARVLRPGGVCLATAVPLFNLNGYWLVNRMVSRFPISNLSRLPQTFTTTRRLRRDFGRAGFSDVAVHGVLLGPVNWIERFLPRILPRALRAWERVDRALADRPILRDFANLLVVHGTRS